MEFWKKWLHIAAVLVLTLSLLSPAAVMAETDGLIENESEQINEGLEGNEEGALSDEGDNNLEKDITKETEIELSPVTTDDSASIKYSEPAGHVTVSVEKFTLGQGYTIEPIQVPFYEKEMVGHVVARVLGSGNYNDGYDQENIGYLANIKDSESDGNIPQYILDVMKGNNQSITGRNKVGWLGQRDYNSSSGWMYTVNNVLPNDALASYRINDGNVIRLQFTVAGLGRDLGFGKEWGSQPYIEAANKDALTAEIAKINSAANKEEILADANVLSAYEAAYEQLTNMESIQPNVDDALDQLIAELNGNGGEDGKIDKTKLKTKIVDAEENKNSVKVSVDGKDVYLTEKWVTQTALDAYVNVIESAQNLIEDDKAIQEEINAKVFALNQAKVTFEKAKKPGTKFNDSERAGYVTVSVEKFTLGQGYAIEPIQVPFSEGEEVGHVVARALGSGNYNDGSDQPNINYLTNIKDSERDGNIPQYILKEAGKYGESNTGRKNKDWLGNSDYYSSSNWMYTVNHKMVDHVMGGHQNKDGDVIRLQFSVVGFGRDLGFNYSWQGTPFIEVANKDALTAKIAEINSASNKEEILADAKVLSAYKAAYEQLTNMESKQEDVDVVFKQLDSALEEVRDITKTALEEAITKAEQNKASIKVSVDGKDVDITQKWVTQAALDDYVKVIKSAQDLIANEAAIQEDIDAKVLALNQATAAFDNAKKPGTKSNINTPTQKAYNTVGKYMVDRLPTPKFGSEWWIITLARGGYEVQAGYYDTYYKNVVDYVVAKKGVLDKWAYTEYSRLIIALTAIGKDPTNVGGYNLVEKLSDFDQVVWQGVNGAYYGLIALDTWDFELPKTATTTREKLIDFILDKQLADKGWALSGTKADPDMTGMAIQSLAPYYNSNPKVKQAVDNALATLSTIQLGNGGYSSWGLENAESAAQVITALASLGIDANKDPRFNKVIANIMTYYSSEDGGFKHVLTETKANGMATEQVGYTLAAYHRLLNKQTALYDTSDTKSNNPSNPGEGGNNPDGEDGNNPGNGGENNNPDGNIPFGKTTFSIRISSSEIPLRATTAELYLGETVFDVLKRVTDENGISLSYRETQYGAYIEGIAGLYEFDRGPLSGWMYRVNGKFPSYSAGLYTLSPGDVVEWLYTLDLGKDIGGYVDGIENGEAPGGGENGECKEDTENCKEENKCTDEDEQCTEETDKDEENGEESKDSADAEITVGEGSDKAVITAENIQQYLENDIQKLVIKIRDNIIEVPTSSLKDITLAEDEKVVASIILDLESKEFTVSFGVETAKGLIKPISLGKDYLKVTLSADDLKPNTVVLQLVEGEYKPVPHKIVNGEIVLFTKTSGTFNVTEKHVTFKDIEKLANKDEIEFLASRLIIQGVTPDKFEPNKQITRAQFAAFISRSLGLQTSGENSFSDTAGKWYANDVQALYEAGITKGTTASTFNPEAPITRQQAAAFMARILEYLNVEAQVTVEANFKDISKISDEYLPYIELLNSLDIMTGKQDGSFDPGAHLTRAQTVKIIKRTLNISDMM
ncbi:S-layer homology domain-containing protein [Solibacillus sp. CAU 1738]|uniref:S-layer homology domain-containing protein n=1 Tax=Solibacillus sp. CAU 1738 TaxID=3140363 RepID=UPI00325FF12D